ncbi:MAG: TetR/AcrR family transcriptional regulator [Phenylobacterium sp.]|uniref:TetR/AcrR family transcriptional regulator n=1 Tax=Phenylobacterium sp. TaxID=1871053 RepID=UPI00271BCD62|nr:TetR/AcrR family transcriptional regulator [Phenylobacterium sp.]MDO8408839.1 TetR/AcrR family transcriptional regulator [Phenylobacterium sp.]
MSPNRSPTERSLLDAAASLLERGGPAAVTTRAVLDEAGVTAPTLYHHFGDKDGLLDALLAEGVTRYFAHRAGLPESDDALADLVASWDLYLDFICEQPQLFSLLMSRAQADPTLLERATAWCRGRLERLQGEGRLAVDVDFGLQALLVSSNGVAMLRAQGGRDGDARDAGRFVFEQTLAGLVQSPGRAGPAAG